MDFDPKQVHIETFSSGVPQVNATYGIRMVHLPSGQCVQGSGASGILLGRALMEELQRKVEGVAPTSKAGPATKTLVVAVPTPRLCSNCGYPLRFDGSTMAWYCDRPTAFCQRRYTSRWFYSNRWAER